MHCSNLAEEASVPQLMITDAKMGFFPKAVKTMLAEEDVMTYITVLMTKIKGGF